MKMHKKSFLSSILAFTLLFSLTISVSAEDVKVLENVNDVYKLVHDNDFVEIYDATLCTDNGNAQAVYYVICRGLDFTETDMRKPRSLANCIKAGLSDDENSYVANLVEIIQNTVPTGSSLVFAGHSLGGMIIEQAIARPELKDNYEILYSLAIGSPYILTMRAKEGTLNRVVDSRDPVPFMSIALLANPYMGNVSIETSGEAPLIHFTSYEKGKCWASYDCLGNKNGNAYIILNECVADYN